MVHAIACLQGISALTRLQALTQLSFQRMNLTDDAMRIVASCTQLKNLALDARADGETELTVAGLLRLTQLTVLTRLEPFFISKDGDTDDRTLVSIAHASNLLDPAQHCQLILL